MAKPAIVAVDDDPQVLAALSRDLRSRYGEDHRVIRAGSGAEALEALADLKSRGDEVAVFVVDQRMPAMTGTEFLREAKGSYPEARTVLLTAYADTEAAISAINDVGLDHYLLKPWDPPEERLYPILDELIVEWLAAHPPAFEGIRVYDTRWSPMGHEVKDFLARNRIPYRFLDVEADTDASAVAGTAELPVVITAEGERLERPDVPTLAHAVGLRTEATTPFYDLIIVGAGPAGLGAAVYGASEGLRTMVVERAATGGQAGTSSRIENYLGFPAGISGGDLATRATTQAQRLGAEILTGPEVVAVEVEEPVKTVTLTGGQQLTCHALVIASGMTIRTLDLPAVEGFVGAGVYYGAAPSEAAGYVDEDVYVVGGANSAGQASMMLSRYARSVTILVRGSSLEAQMSQYLIDQIKATDNISVRLRTEVTDGRGTGRLEGLQLTDRDTGETEEVDATGLFIFVGAVPHSDFVADIVTRDRRGFIRTGTELKVDGEWPVEWTLDRDPFQFETNVPGIFAAGDVRAGAIRRVATAVGQGAAVVNMVHQYLEEV
jgi:thioredoxin reductase (NADPH)